MICGNVDMGSNTIRLSVYEVQKNEIQLLFHKKVTAGLAGYIESEFLNQEGVDKACEVLNDFKKIWNSFHISPVFVFATASLRNIKNTQEVLESIQKETGIEVDVITGEEEARLDFFGATYELQLKEGLLIDIGGGSTELVDYQDARIIAATSLPIGSLNMYSRFVQNLFPDKDEKKKIKDYILKEFAKHPKFFNREISHICGVGGTVRSTLKLQNSIYGYSGQNTIIHGENIGKMIKSLQTAQKNTYRTILKTAPDRIHTILPGMIILKAFITSFDVRSIQVSKAGVREGYLYQKILQMAL